MDIEAETHEVNTMPWAAPAYHQQGPYSNAFGLPEMDSAALVTTGQQLDMVEDETKEATDVSSSTLLKPALDESSDHAVVTAIEAEDVEIIASAHQQPTCTSSTSLRSLINTSLQQSSDVPSTTGIDDCPLDTTCPVRSPIQGQLAALVGQFPVLDTERPLLPLRRRQPVLRNGAATQRQSSKSRVPCSMCRKYLGVTADDIQTHLRRHLDELSGEHICKECQIGFVTLNDLEWHRHCVSASPSHCGYSFDQFHTCTGHHPPGPNSIAWSEHDRMQLWTGLRHWEQLQIRSLMQDIDKALMVFREPSEHQSSEDAICARSTYP